MTKKLRAAAQAVVDRWDSPLWKSEQHTGEFINTLRAALAEAEHDSWQPIETAPPKEEA